MKKLIIGLGILSGFSNTDAMWDDSAMNSRISRRSFKKFVNDDTLNMEITPSNDIDTFLMGKSIRMVAQVKNDQSEIDGVVKSINNGNQDSYSYSGGSQAFMSIIAMGDFRIKCKVNEQNIASVTPGQAVIVHSRVDDSVTWKGTMGAVDKENPGNGSNNGYYFSSGDGSTQSNSYPFYIELDSSEGLMLGQHVYVEAGECGNGFPIVVNDNKSRLDFRAVAGQVLIDIYDMSGTKVKSYTFDIE